MATHSTSAPVVQANGLWKKFGDSVAVQDLPIEITRLSLGGMGGIDVLLSLAVLTLSVTVVVWLTARLFRAYLLVHGQQPGMGHLIRTLRGR